LSLLRLGFLCAISAHAGPCTTAIAQFEKAVRESERVHRRPYLRPGVPWAHARTKNLFSCVMIMLFCFAQRLRVWLAGQIETLYPGSFALVMATEIISNALFFDAPR